MDKRKLAALARKNAAKSGTTSKVPKGFGKKYDANYAPLTGADGKLTGALFVAVPE